MLKSIRAKDLEWVKKQCYVTLVESEPGAHRIVILIEKSNTINRGYMDPYIHLAVVVSCEDMTLTVNGELAENEEIGDELSQRLIDLCEEASSVAAVGQGYFSDPDAS